MQMCWAVLSRFSRGRLLATLWTVARQAPLYLGFSSKNAGVGCHALLQGIFRIEPMVSYVSYITGRLFTTSATCDHMQMQLINYMPSFHTTGFRSGSVVKNLPAWQETLERRV